MTARGALTRAEANQKRTRHGHARKGAITPVYQRWLAMLSRCNNPDNISWRYYGGKGIRVCDRWTQFENFLADMGEPPTPKHSLDRKNTLGDYSPTNCRWVLKDIQDNNRTSNRCFSYDGRTQNATQWANELGMKPATMLGRLNAGWTPERMITTPVRKSKSVRT